MMIEETEESPVWEAVATLENEFYTFDEIADILESVATDVRVND